MSRLLAVDQHTTERALSAPATRSASVAVPLLNRGTRNLSQRLVVHARWRQQRMPRPAERSRAVAARLIDLAMTAAIVLDSASAAIEGVRLALEQ